MNPGEWLPGQRQSDERVSRHLEAHEEQDLLELQAQMEGDSFLRVISGIILGLLVLFASGVLLDALPLRLLDPRWQARLCESLVDYAPIPLVAFGLAHLAAFLAPPGGRLAARRDAMRHAAVAVVLGYLLLIPLQGFVFWQEWSAMSKDKSARLVQVYSQIGELRGAINTASSAEELQQRLLALRAPMVPPKELGKWSFAEIKKLMLGRVDNYQAQLRNRVKDESVGDSRELKSFPAGLRVIVAALGLALAWAAGAQVPGQSGSLLDQWLATLDRSREQQFRRAQQRHRRDATVDWEFLEQLSGGDPVQTETLRHNDSMSRSQPPESPAAIRHL